MMSKKYIACFIAFFDTENTAYGFGEIILSLSQLIMKI